MHPLPCAPEGLLLGAIAYQTLTLQNSKFSLSLLSGSLMNKQVLLWLAESWVSASQASFSWSEQSIDTQGHQQVKQNGAHPRNTPVVGPGAGLTGTMETMLICMVGQLCRWESLLWSSHSSNHYHWRTVRFCSETDQYFGFLLLQLTDNTNWTMELLHDTVPKHKSITIYAMLTWNTSQHLIFILHILPAFIWECNLRLFILNKCAYI